MAEQLILVTGATGNTGAGIATGLLARGCRVRALVRDPTKGEGLRAQGAEPVVADLDNPSSLRPQLFDGVTDVYSCTWNGPTAFQQWQNLHAALKEAGASPRVVRLGAFGSPESRIITQHEEVVQDLTSSGLAWTILKPTFFMQNTMMAAQTVKEQGTVYFDWGDGKAGMVDVRDIVDSAVAVLATTDGRFDGQSFVLTGPEAIGFAEVAAHIGRAIGKEVTYVPVPHAAAKEAMVGMGVPEWIADGFVELDAGFANNFANMTTTNVEKLTSHQPRSFGQFAQDFRDVWRG